MDAANLNMVIDQVSKDKGIDRMVLVRALEEAILASAKKAFGAERAACGVQRRKRCG